MSEAASPVGSFPERVGKYELLLPLGTGGTATVYLARSRGVAGFEREVALKLVHAHLRTDEESRLHLLEEARLAARIRHPNVVPVTEVDSDDCGVFLVMDYVEGESLSSLVRLLRDQDQRMPPRLAARIMNDALAGLHAAHELTSTSGDPLELVHRDFSPQNILVGVEGVARLADFGVAKAASRTVRTKTGLVKGKIAYMSPEQARGYSVDRRCDVWAAGVVIWELITGRKLYEHEDDVAILLSVVTETPPRLSDVMAGIPQALDDAVASALTSNVDERCSSAEELRKRLEVAWDDAGGMATPSELGQFVKETVADKLAERRAMVANQGRPRAITAPLTQVKLNRAQLAEAPLGPLSSTSSPGLISAPALAEEGTKTAISAAVPSAEQLGFGRKSPFSRRAIGAAVIATSLALTAAALVSPNWSSSGPVIETPPPVRFAPIAAANTSGKSVEPPTAPATESVEPEKVALAPAADPPEKKLERKKPAPGKRRSRNVLRKKKKKRSRKRKASRPRRSRSGATLARKKATTATRKKTSSRPANSSSKPTDPNKTKRSGPPPLLLAPDPYQKSK